MTLSGEAFINFVPDYATTFLCAAGRMSAGASRNPAESECGLCGARGDLKQCTTCRRVYYCNKEHQREHWPLHKASCNPSQAQRGNPRTRNGKKNKAPKTNFNLDRGVLDEVAGSGSGAGIATGATALDYNEMQFQGNGGQGRGRRKYQMPDLSTPIDSSHSLEPTSQAHRPKTPPLYHVLEESQTLEECGFTQEWFTGVVHDVIRDLNTYGVCVVDDFLGPERAERILGEVHNLHSRGVFQAGQVVSRQVQDQAIGKIRGDKITWVTGNEPQCSAIGQLVSVVDSLVAKANKHHEAGKLAQYNITWRTRAMVACYPGCDTHYVKHVDNPNGDGRCITAIYYLNKHWTAGDGGVLRIYPENCTDTIAAINPCFDRMLFFWSDRRNPHEVLPAKIVRYAITVWYLDQKEREDYLAREMTRGSPCT